MAITDWPCDDRPREKLLNQGPNALSDAELLAIFLRTGCAGKSAVDLARDLLQKFGGLKQLLHTDRASFCASHGLGEAKYAQLQACLEMSRRHLKQQLRTNPASLNSSQTVKNYLSAKLGHRENEVFAALFLDTRHQLLRYEEMFQGTIDGAAVYPREVVKAAIKANAHSVILAHNHPSGIAEPSEPDKNVTKTIKAALQLVDIQLLDHIIVGDAVTSSLAEHGLL